MSADLTPKEAQEQHDLWTSKLNEATEESQRYQRLAQGYSRMVEGLRLIFPELAADSPVTRPTDETTTLTIESVPTQGVVATDMSMRTDDAVMRVLADHMSSGDTGWVSSKTIASEIANRSWRLDTDKPETVIRKFLNRARLDGRVESTDLDGRTKGYRLPGKTPGDVALTTPPGPVSTTRSGGDTDESAPSLLSTVPQDHDPTSSERDDRDHHRLADDRVAVQF